MSTTSTSSPYTVFVIPSTITPQLTIKLHSSNATIPVKGSRGAAGFDLFAAEDVEIKSMENSLISTDLSILLPPGTYGRIAPRSGLALKHNILVNAGVIDIDYTGILSVLLFNLGKVTYNVRKGDRIAQLICEQIVYPQLLVSNALILHETERNTAGFGSTGL